ncbi:MAG TPA: class II aldolase/adducin family protein [Xanthobacteraceae bacterium]|nr:class II aldolase/adducin family protein [Xanthobacteraceae bacterium]
MSSNSADTRGMPMDDEVLQQKQIEVRQAARALSRAGLVDAYGHCSTRLDEESFLVCKSGPMGLISPGENGTACPVEGPLPDGVLGEVRVHQKIYERRPDIGAVCRVIPPQVMAMSVLGRPPKARHGFGAFFYPSPAFWDDPTLMRSDAIAAAVAQALGNASGIILRGNGAVVAAATMKQAVTLTWFLEDMCRVELAVLTAGEADTAPLLTAAEAKHRADWAGQVAERMWSYLTFGDPETERKAGGGRLGFL